MIFVDTNYFVRFFINDNSDQYGEAAKLFGEAAKNRLKLFTSVVVFFEVNWVLTSFYKFKKNEVKTVLRGILDMPFLEIDNKECLADCLESYEKSNLGLEDVYYLEYAKKMGAIEFKTFDVNLDRAFKK
jgi:predicted nucleic-acid-binding protein